MYPKLDVITLPHLICRPFTIANFLDLCLAVSFISMASSSTQQPSQTAPKSSFFQQRDALVGEIAVVRLSLPTTVPSRRY